LFAVEKNKAKKGYKKYSRVRRGFFSRVSRALR
jgi:hypothetical protein